MLSNKKQKKGTKLKYKNKEIPLHKSIIQKMELTSSIVKAELSEYYEELIKIAKNKNKDSFTKSKVKFILEWEVIIDNETLREAFKSKKKPLTVKGIRVKYENKNCGLFKFPESKSNWINNLGKKWLDDDFTKNQDARINKLD